MICRSNESVTTIKDTMANPTPLSLHGFGMATMLLNMHNAGSEGIVCGRVLLLMCSTR